MKKKFDKKMMKLIAESQEFGIDDRLSDILSRNSELSEDDLQFVAAAAGPDYNRFKQMIDSKK